VTTRENLMKTLDELRQEALLAWNAACDVAEAAHRDWRAVGAHKYGAEYEAWRAACEESRRTSDIYMAMRPKVLPDIPAPGD